MSSSLSPEMVALKHSIWRDQDEDRQALEELLSSSMGGMTERFIDKVCEHAKKTMRALDKALEANPQLKAGLSASFRRDLITDYVFNLKIAGGTIKIELDEDRIIEILQSTARMPAAQGQGHGSGQSRARPTISRKYRRRWITTVLMPSDHVHVHTDPTAWQAVCDTYPALTIQYPPDGPSDEKFKDRCGRPSVRPLRERPANNPPGRGQRPQPFTPGAKDVNIIAALYQVLGDVSAKPCVTCSRTGRWEGCIGAKFSPEGVRVSACANCMVSNNQGRCKLAQ
ncbi:hypothetical protein GGR57DRAFT_486122 [Xylariaceae sp. FL1272]|nr:hypothetical protein GGR57DRAFT_486122 [Xylariaceae sp. FL1272]